MGGLTSNEHDLPSSQDLHDQCVTKQDRQHSKDKTRLQKKDKGRKKWKMTPDHRQ